MIAPRHRASSILQAQADRLRSLEQLAGTDVNWVAEQVGTEMIDAIVAVQSRWKNLLKLVEQANQSGGCATPKVPGDALV